jgi:hypothetical protein
MRPVSLLFGAVLVLGCDSRQEGLVAVGGEEASTVEATRYLRRLHLDLVGEPPAESELQAGLTRLETDGNKAAVRREIALALLEDARFASTWVGELENRLFAGSQLDDVYDFLCGITRAIAPACMACTSAEPCDCTCQAIAEISTEMEGLRGSADALASGDPSATIERAYAESRGYQTFFATPDAVAIGMFDDFLYRAPEPEELQNAVNMVFGALVPGAPAGLLFLRHGSNVEDLVDILFESEVYREAAVGAVFSRYLGRPASPAEQAHFAARLDPDEPDVRDVIADVVSSREYFDQ